jgi:peptidyl-prolyl cis-trans isomerase D
MLQKIRDRAQGWLATLILVGVTIPFVFWGIDEYLRMAKEVVVAEIDGEEVSLREFQHSYQRHRQQLQSLFGSNFDPKLFDETQLKKETLDQLVDTRLLLQLGQRTGMRISNEQVAAAIQAEEAFQKDGKFAAPLYEQRLKSAGLNPVAFEEQLRQGLLTEQLQQMVSGSAFVTTQDLEKAARL